MKETNMIIMRRNEKTSMQYRKICIFCGGIHYQDTNFKSIEKGVFEGDCDCSESIEFNKIPKKEIELRREYINKHQKVWYVTSGKYNEHIFVGRKEYENYLLDKKAEIVKSDLELKEKRKLQQIVVEKKEIEYEKAKKEYEEAEVKRVIVRDKSLKECSIKDLVKILIYINKENNIIENHIYHDDNDLDCTPEELDKEIIETLGKHPYDENSIHQDEIYEYIENNLEDLFENYIDAEIDRREYEERMDE